MKIDTNESKLDHIIQEYIDRRLHTSVLILLFWRQKDHRIQLLLLSVQLAVIAYILPHVFKFVLRAVIAYQFSFHSCDVS
jgi:hypothetical protein